MLTKYRDNYSLGAPGIAEGTNANTFKITNAFSYVLGGRAYYKAATDNLAFSAGTALGNSQRSAFFVAIDAAGTVTTIQGSIVTPSPSGDQRKAAEIPNPSDKTVIGFISVTTGAAATFTPAATDLSAAGVTGAYGDFGPDYSTPVAL